MIKPVPDGFGTITPHIVVNEAEKAIEFYKKAFGAQEISKAKGPTGKIIHAMVRIGDSLLMLNDEFPENKVVGPNALGGTPFALHIYTDDPDKMYKQAVGAGAIEIMPISDMFWGDRYGQIQDPFGHRWAIAAHVKDMSPEQMKQATKEYFASSSHC